MSAAQDSPRPAPTTPVVAVVGATATGKSALGIALAQRLGGEVVNADAMQLYRGMDIGTAKLGPADRGGVPHHLLDLWDVTETASVAAYQRLARDRIAALRDAGRVAVVVGGSGLYVRAAVDRLEFPGTDTRIRERWEAALAAEGAPALHARLAAVDPAAAAAILPGNGRRIVRALEVVELTGRPFSATLPSYDSPYPLVVVDLDLPLDELDRRIDARVAAMFAGGLLDEVRRLVQVGLRDGRTASRALGYEQALAVLDGVLDEADAVAQTQAATRRFARRQRSWFRRDPRRVTLDARDPELLARALAIL